MSKFNKFVPTAAENVILKAIRAEMKPIAEMLQHRAHAAGLKEVAAAARVRLLKVKGVTPARIKTARENFAATYNDMNEIDVSGRSGNPGGEVQNDRTVRMLIKAVCEFTNVSRDLMAAGSDVKVTDGTGKQVLASALRKVATQNAKRTLTAMLPVEEAEEATVETKSYNFAEAICRDFYPEWNPGEEDDIDNDETLRQIADYILHGVRTYQAKLVEVELKKQKAAEERVKTQAAAKAKKIAEKALAKAKGKTKAKA